MNIFIILGIFSYAVYEKETILKKGTSVLIPLAPVDPRSLLQGDYMILNYDLREVEKKANKLHRGYLSYTVNENNVVVFKNVHSEYNETDKLLLFKKRKRRLFIGAESYFFQEGRAKHFEQAKYAELKITDKGKTLLVGLKDENFNSL